MLWILAIFRGIVGLVSSHWQSYTPKIYVIKIPGYKTIYLVELNEFMDILCSSQKYF
jgi:hypothetical protein